MILIQEHQNGIKVEGHANYAPYGQDIVCAGISALVRTLILSLGDNCDYSLIQGESKVLIRNPDERSKVLMDSFLIGATAIAADYPEFVKVTRLASH